MSPSSAHCVLIARGWLRAGLSYDERVEESSRSDLELARELMAGSADAFERFVDVYYRKIFRYSFTMCGHREDAEEVAQDTLMKVFENLAQLREPERLKAWVFRIAKNACLTKRRKSLFAPARELSLDELHPRLDGESGGIDIADWSALPDSAAENAELRAILEGAVQRLPELYRSIFLLRDVEGLSTAESAEILGVSEDVVKTRLHRARLMLRADVDAYLKGARV
jgi:RNA polymerase sigma-70 factor (ECF subfamily)